MRFSNINKFNIKVFFRFFHFFYFVYLVYLVMIRFMIRFTLRFTLRSIKLMIIFVIGVIVMIKRDLVILINLI